MFQQLCERERCPFAVVGEATEEKRLVLDDPLFGNRPIDLPLDVLLGKPPRMHRVETSLRRPQLPLSLSLSLTEAVRRVLAHPAVADKTFLISIGDRTLGGLICRDQMVGPWQVPVADCAVTAAAFDVYTGEAMAMGERTPVAVNNAAASARLAVGEALTNLAAAQIGDLGKVNLSANWMAAPAVPGDAADLYAAVQAVGMELCPALGITIPVGKDSMSMSTVWQEGGESKRMTAPISLIVSAFAPVADIRLSLTPQLRYDLLGLPSLPDATGRARPLGAPGATDGPAVHPYHQADSQHSTIAQEGTEKTENRGSEGLGSSSSVPSVASCKVSESISDTVLLLIDLGRGRNRLGGSILAQVVSQMGADTPDVDSAADLKAFWSAIQQLGREQKLLAYHDRSDGGLLATAVEMAFAGHVGVDLELPTTAGTEVPSSKSQGPSDKEQGPSSKDQVPSAKDQDSSSKIQVPEPGTEVGNSAPSSSVLSVSSCKDGAAFARLFSEELGAVIQVRAADRDAVNAILRAHGLDTATTRIGTLNGDYAFRVHQDGTVLIDENLSTLRAIWSDVTRRISALRDNPACAESEYQLKLDPADPGITPVITFDLQGQVTSNKFQDAPPALGTCHLEPGTSAPPLGTLDLGLGTSSSPLGTWNLGLGTCASGFGTWNLAHDTSRSRPPVAVLREQGVNGEVEMAAAFTRAGFTAIDVHMTDILSGRITLADFRGLVACGGFSYGDVLGAGEGWAKSILFHDRARAEFAAFFAREDTFALGVCNGCQMMSNLHSIIPGSGHWPRFVQNRSERYEGRLISVKIEPSPSVLFAGMEGSVIPLVTAHGEGYAEFPSAVAARRCSESGLVCARFVDNKQALALAQSRRSPTDEGGQALAQSRRDFATAGGRTPAPGCGLASDSGPIYTEQYPLNPNGSPFGITALTTTTGRVTILMPHPERVFRTVALSWHPADWPEDSPWMKLFRNARAWVG